MYGLPSDFDVKFMVGRTLEQVCFNENQIALHFDDDLSIILESAFSHERSQSSSDSGVVEVPVTCSDLMELLGFSIARSSGDKDGTLTLEFDNGHILRCFDNSREYESYKIEYRGNLIVV